MRRLPAGWFYAAALALIALGLFTAVRSPRARQVPLDGARVIVAPLENRTGDAELDLVGTMVAEWVTQGVARSGLVEVVDSRTMLFSAREVERSGSPQYLSALAEETGAGIVVSGSYYREGDSLRFQTRIVDPRGGSVRQSVDVVTAPAGRPTEALEPLRERIMGALAVLLDARLNNPAVASSQPPTFEAYRHFLLGMQSFGSDFESDYAHFIRAAQLDTGYVQAQLWAGIASANLRQYPRADSLLSRLDSLRDRLAPYDQANLEYFHRGFVRGEWQRSHAGAVRMLQLAPDAGHAAYAVGLTAAIRNRPREALDALLKIDLDRGWGRSWEQQVVNLITRSYHLLGRHEPELEWARRLRRSDPAQGWVRIAEARALAALGRLEELDQRLEESLAYPPNARGWEPFSPGELALAAARELAAHGHPEAAARVTGRAVTWHLGRAESERAVPAERRVLARALLAAGRLAEARRIHEEVVLDPFSEPERLGTLGVIAAREGRATDARRLSDSLAALSPRHLFGSPSYWRARIAARSGHPDESVRLLRQALSEGMGRFYLFHSEPDLQPLRGHAGFDALLKP